MHLDNDPSTYDGGAFSFPFEFQREPHQCQRPLVVLLANAITPVHAP